jgi:hypothetical protein
MFIALTLAAATLVVWQMYVTLLVAMSAGLTRRQKALQALIIWLFPLFGALLCKALLSTDGGQRRPTDARFAPERDENPPGTGVHGLH